MMCPRRHLERDDSLVEHLKAAMMNRLSDHEDQALNVRLNRSASS